MAQGFKVWLKEGVAGIIEKYRSCARDWAALMKQGWQTKSVWLLAIGTKQLAVFVLYHALAILFISLPFAGSPGTEIDLTKGTGGVGSAIARAFRFH